MKEYTSLRLGIACNDSPKGLVPVFYMTGKKFYYLGNAETKGDADKLGRVTCTVLAVYVLAMVTFFYTQG